MMNTLTKGFVRSALLLVVCSSLAYALHGRHVAWDGLAVGKGGSKIRAAVSMEDGETPGTTAVQMSLKGDVAGALHPWHVHVGSCAKAGPVFGSAVSYRAIQASAAGTGESNATLRVLLPESGSYYVNIHESAAKMKSIVACGDLFLEE